MYYSQLKIHLRYLFILLIITQYTNAQQISIPRIDLMNDLPPDYQLKDWKKTTLDYDNFIFDLNNVGEYLPLVNINPNSGINYPEINHIRLDTYVGQRSPGSGAEAINLIPAIVGASLVGCDKTSHYDINWVSKIKDFFNLRNGQNVYLNNYSANTGNDWWYETMPNVFFYQLLSLYPNVDIDYHTQFKTVADRQLWVVYQLGGSINPWQYPNMNYRAFNLLTGEPRPLGVPEPEAAGAIAWILYQAYKQTNNVEYRYGAELALDFLQNETKNPSYEIQLPYGILTAAQMNAIEGTNYDIDKMLNWAFSSGHGTLRQWGCIVGNWNGFEMSGLIGEANDRGNDYAFSMNGFQHAAALVPMVKYDKRYAKAIAKWILNLANASRYFYRDGLPPENQCQQSYEWSVQFDENGSIPYESIKENYNNTKPYAMGDAVNGNWSETNLSLYSGSSVGYLAALLDSTNVNGILQIDLNKTDFRGNNLYPAYLYYNPYSVSHEIILNVGNDPVNIYDAISETIMNTNVIGDINFQIDANNIRMPVIFPYCSDIESDGHILKVKSGEIIDYHYNYNFTPKLRIKAFSSNKSVIVHNEKVIFNCLIENESESVKYEWIVNGELSQTTTVGTFEWKAPASDCECVVLCLVSDSQSSVMSHILRINVIDPAFAKPEIKKIDLSGTEPYNISSQIKITAETNNVSLSTMEWKCTGGRIEKNNSLEPVWFLPDTEGVYEITLTINNLNGSDSKTEKILVKDLNLKAQNIPLIYYPFNGDTKNYAQDMYHAISVGAIPVADTKGIESSAYKFTSANEYIYVPNELPLNFTEKIAVSFWIKPDYLSNDESYIISHGSWEERFKVSVIPSKHLRWTLKTNESVIDIDDPEPLETGKFTHYIGQYTGYSLELYRNGQLAAYNQQKGSISTTYKSITFARKDEQERNYTFRGTIDEVRIYDTDLSLSEIAKLPDLWTLKFNVSNKMIIHPNPVGQFFNISIPYEESINKIEIINLTGKTVWKKDKLDVGNFYYVDIFLNSGIYILKVSTTNNRKYVSRLIRK